MKWIITAAAIAAGGGSVFAGAVTGPLEYLSEADSPYAGLDGWVREDFEDGLLNIPGVSVNGGSVIGPSSVTDSVDGDDGAIDGSGSNGWSLFFTSPNGLTVTFDAGVIGGAPVSAGIVWTDGLGDVTFRAFDTTGNLIGETTASHAGTGFSGDTDEDRFYGVDHAAGIGSIFIITSGGGFEVDHLQYVIPTPGAAGLLVCAGLVGSRRRRG